MILKGAGFQEDSDFLVMHNFDDKIVKEAIRLVENNT